jgi:hypothetical protein
MESSDLNMAVSLTMLCAIPVGLWIQYLIVKAAVRNGVIEADRALSGQNGNLGHISSTSRHSAEFSASGASLAPAEPPPAAMQRPAKPCGRQDAHEPHKYPSNDGGQRCPGYPPMPAGIPGGF